MKFGVGGDSHYDLNDGELKRTQDIHNTFLEVINTTIEEGCDYFFHCGDFYDNNRPTTDAIALSIRALNKLEDAEIETWILVGNHDVISQSGRTSALEVIKAINYDHIHVVEIPTMVKRDNVNFLLLPHVAKSKMIEMGYSKIEEFWETEISNLTEEKKNIYAFAHHNISGAVSGSEAWMIRGDEQILPESLFKNNNVKYIFNGHIHKPQVLKKYGKEKVIIVGSMECLNMGEKNEDKKFLIVEV